MGKSKFRLPAAEDDLWEQVVLALLRQRDAELRARDHLRLLEELAFHARFCGKRLTITFVENTATWLAEQRKFGSPREKAQEWLKELEEWELLVLSGNGSDAVFEFPIPGLDEYFAARHLAARWAEEDKRYQDWLPCFAGRLMRSKKLECPNPHCHVALPQFRKLLRQSEYEETLLLMVGLLKEAKREEVFLYVIRGNIINWLLIKTNLPITLSFLLAFALAVVAGVDLHGRGSGLLLAVLLVPIWWCVFGLLFFLLVSLTYKLLERTLFNGLRSHLNLKLKALSRCRHAHRDFAQAVMKAVISSFIHYNSLDLYMPEFKEGFTAIGSARLRENVEGILGCFRCALRHFRRTTTTGQYGWCIATSLQQIGEEALELLIESLRDENAEVREWACLALSEVDNEQVIRAMQRLLEDRDEVACAAAQRALERMNEIRHRRLSLGLKASL